jgi:hypothetical protein
MKLAVLMLSLMLGSIASAQTIVIAEKPLPANARAAKELQKYVAQMTGTTLPIQDDTAALPNRAILIGPSKALDGLQIKLDKEKLGSDGFILKTVGNHLVIAGPGPRGSMYGTYELLEKLGLRWLTQSVTIVPKTQKLELPTLDETQVPAFEYREPYFTEAFEKEWAAHNRIVGATAHLDSSTGGTIRYADFVHTFDHLIPQDLYAKHPEYFPMVGGKRINGYVQRCLTNPDVLKLTIENVKKTFDANPDDMITSVSQNDADKWCECDECKKLAKQYGGQTGVYIWFVNQVAEAIGKDPKYSDKLIDTLAYQFTESPPKNITPRKNVRIRLCPINVCQAHPYDRDDFPASKAFASNLAAWAKITDTMYIWHYNTDFAHYLMPFPDFNQFPESIRLYRKSGVRGIFFEGAYANGGGGSDAELRSWVMAKLMWNPDLDSDKLVTEWMTGVYGPAEKPMRAWFDLLHKNAADPKHHFTCYVDTNAYYIPAEAISKGDELFDEAETLAKGNATASEYVAKSRLWLRFVKLARHVGGEDVNKFFADCKKFGITHISEGQKLKEWVTSYK